MALVANELLAFIQHAIDTMDEVSIMQICKSSFTSEDICQGKHLLYETLGQSANMPSRRRDGIERSVQDIISLLKQTDPDEVPAFVAKKLHKLPPVTLDHVDVVTLLKDIRFLKEELAEVRGRLQASESTISDLRNELSQLKSGNSICRSPDAAFVTRRRGAQAITFSPSALSDGSTHEHVIAAAAASPAARSPPATEPRPNYASIVACPPPPPPRSKNKGKKEAPAKECPPSEKDRKCDDDGFIRVERKKKKPVVRNHRGTAPEGPEQLLRRETPATPLYVSRLHWSTTVEQVVDYIRSKTHFVLRVERLESRHKVNFSSFVVRVPTHHLPTFEKEEFWPIGIVYRRFRGRLPNTSRPTSQTIRV